MIWEILFSIGTQVGVVIAVWVSFHQLSKKDKQRENVRRIAGWATALAIFNFAFNCHMIWEEHEDKQQAKREKKQEQVDKEKAQQEAVALRQQLKESEDRLMAEFKRVTEANFERYKPALETNYNKGYVVLSILGSSISPSVSKIDSFRIDWNTAKVLRMNTELIDFRLPDIYPVPGTSVIKDHTAVFSRKEADPILVLVWEGLGIFVEVLQDHPMGVTLAVGFKAVDVPNLPIPQKWHAPYR